jgi:hypothetical protein
MPNIGITSKWHESMLMFRVSKNLAWLPQKPVMADLIRHPLKNNY